MTKQLVLAFLCLFFKLSSYSQEVEIAQITVNTGKFDRENSMVKVSLNGLELDIANSGLVLYALSGKKESKVDAQIEMKSGPSLWWKISENANKTLNFSLRKSDTNKSLKESSIHVEKIQGNLVITSHGKNVLQYNLKEAPLPEGVPPIYNRAGYIHPLWSPKGEVLTRIQPPDHYHHLGIWNPWTHTEFKGKTIDFWNLVEGQGTVKPVSVISTLSNNLFGGFRILQDHVDLNGKTPDGFEVALKEELEVKVWNIDQDGWVVDFTSTLNCATDSLLTITEYRYQGFGYRATKKWDDQTATLLTSEGKDKADGNSTRARWCDVNGVSDFGTSGVLFITNPTNYNYPEPIRIWPVGTNEGKENVFFNFNPTMDRDWILEPGRDYQLKYRMYVYDGKIDSAKAERLWQDFAYPPTTTINLIRK